MEVTQFNVYIDNMMNQLIIYNLKNPIYKEKFKDVIRMPMKFVTLKRSCNFCNETDGVYFMFIKSPPRGTLLTGYAYCKKCINHAKNCIASYDFNFYFPTFYTLYSKKVLSVIRSNNIIDCGWHLPDETRLYEGFTGEYMIELYKNQRNYNNTNIKLYDMTIIMDIDTLIKIES